MKIEWIQAFAALAKSGNFIDASEQIYTSQSNLSKYIKNLESDRGLQLFDRTTPAVSVTQAGKTLLPLAESLLGEYDAFRFRAELLSATAKTVVRVVTVSLPLFNNYIFNFLEFNSHSQKIKIEVDELPVSEVVSALTESRASLGILRRCSAHTLPAHMKWRQFPLLSDELVMLCHKDHPLAHVPELSVSDALSYPLAVLNMGLPEYRVVFSDLGIPHQRAEAINSAVKCTSLVTLKNFVKNNYGISILAGYSARSLVSSSDILIREFKEHPDFSLVFAVKEEDLKQQAIQQAIGLIV